MCRVGRGSQSSVGALQALQLHCSIRRRAATPAASRPGAGARASAAAGDHQPRHINAYSKRYATIASTLHTYPAYTFLRKGPRTRNSSTTRCSLDAPLPHGIRRRIYIAVRVGQGRLLASSVWARVCVAAAARRCHCRCRCRCRCRCAAAPSRRSHAPPQCGSTQLSPASDAAKATQAGLLNLAAPS